MLVQFIDYGDTEELNAASLKSLPHGDLVTLPPQVGDLAVKHCFSMFYELMLFLLYFWTYWTPLLSGLGNLVP